MRAIARWNPASDAWETDQLRICGHSDVFSETFPTSGMTAAGTAYAQPTSAPLMGGSGSSSLLPTPTSHQDGSASNLEARQARVDAAKEKHGRIFGKSLAVALAGLPPSPQERGSSLTQTFSRRRAAATATALESTGPAAWTSGRLSGCSLLLVPQMAPRADPTSAARLAI